MDDKTISLLAEIDWLYDEIKELQEYIEELQQEIKDAKYSPLVQRHMEG